MLEGKQLILATKPYAQDDQVKSWLCALSTLGLLVIAFLGSFLSFHPLIRIACSVIEALLLSRMFVIYHDYLHKTILKKSVLANIIFTLFGYYMLTPKSIWQRSHDYHHKHNSKLYTSSIGSFPIVTTEKFISMTKLQRLNYLFIRHPLTIALGYVFAFAWGITIRSLVRSPRKHWDSALALIFHYGIMIYIGINYGWITALLTVLLPMIIAHGLGSYLFYVQHNFPGATFEEKEGWTYIGAAMNSSSFLKMSRIMQWFTANIGFHHIHHMNAKIPFYRLPQVFNEMPEFQNPKSTSMKFRDVVRCMQLKVWDPDLNRMLTLKEVQKGASYQ